MSGSNQQYECHTVPELRRRARRIRACLLSVRTSFTLRFGSDSSHKLGIVRWNPSRRQSFRACCHQSGGCVWLGIPSGPAKLCQISQFELHPISNHDSGPGKSTTTIDDISEPPANVANHVAQRVLPRRTRLRGHAAARPLVSSYDHGQQLCSWSSSRHATSQS